MNPADTDNPVHTNAFRGPGQARSMEEILAEIRRTAAAGHEQTGEPPAHARCLDDDRMNNDGSEHDRQPRDQALSQGSQRAIDAIDLPAILKAPRSTAVVRPLRPRPSKGGLTEALRNAGILSQEGASHETGRASDGYAETLRTLQNPSKASAIRTGFAFLDAHLSPATGRAGEPDDEVEQEEQPHRQSGSRPSHAQPRTIRLRTVAAVASGMADARTMPDAVAGSSPADAGRTIVGHAVALATALEVDLNRRRMRIATMAGEEGLEVGRVASAQASAQDAVAELLRPMLRQWLADNMPRIVETALHLELAEALTSARRSTSA